MVTEIRKNTWYAVLAAVILFLAGAIGSVKADAYDAARMGSITVELNDIGTGKNDVGFRCYQIAKMADGTEMSFQLLPQFEESGVDVNSLKTAADYKECAAKLAASKGKADAASVYGKTDAQGIAKFSVLEHGIYLIEQADAGTYGIVQPFLVAIPCMENGKDWDYDVHAAAKGERIPPQTEEPQTESETENGQSETNPKDGSGSTGTGSGGGSSVKTGDGTMVELYAILALMSGMVFVAGAVRYGKQYRRKKDGH